MLFIKLYCGEILPKLDYFWYNGIKDNVDKMVLACPLSIKLL